MIRIFPLLFFFVFTVGAFSKSTSACSDLANICAMNQAHHQQMMDIAATPQYEEEYYEEEPYYYDSSTYPPMLPAPDTANMVMGMSGMMTSVAQNYDDVMADPRRPAYLNGEWIYPGSELKNPPKDLPCSALYMRKGVGALLLGPPPGEQMASIIFFGPDIPRPTSSTKIEVTLKQKSDGSSQTTNVINMPFEEDFGAVLFAVPTMPLLVDNMVNAETFDIIMNGKSIANLEWSDGAIAKGKLASCMKKK